MPTIVCHVTWMANYSGREGFAQGGGAFVDEHGSGGEACNFLSVNGHCYGWVGNGNRNINLGMLGAAARVQSLENVDVVWTATRPENGKRLVVGWYRNATVYSPTLSFKGAGLGEFPTTQHKDIKLSCFRFKALDGNCVLLPDAQRTLNVHHGRGHPGWPGQLPWWYPNAKIPDVNDFLNQLAALMNQRAAMAAINPLPALETEMVERLKRDRQPAFRQAILNAYGGKCCLTDCGVLACLEACHIDRYANNGNNDVSNGLALRADLHRLFDAGMLTFEWINGHLQALFSPDAAQHYAGIRRRVSVPEQQNLRPDQRAVRAHATTHQIL